MRAVDRLQSLMDSGQLDPDNPEHRALMDRAGIDLNLRGDDLRRALSDREHNLQIRRDDLEQRNNELRHQIDENEALIEGLQRGEAQHVIDGAYQNPRLEGAARTAEQRLGRPIDRDNPDPEAAHGIRRAATGDNITENIVTGAELVASE